MLTGLTGIGDNKLDHSFLFIHQQKKYFVYSFLICEKVVFMNYY